MTALLWQTALLLFAAYFVGAWLGCMIRRTFFFARARSDEAQHFATSLAVPGAPTDASSGQFERGVTGEGLVTGPGPAAPLQRSPAASARAAAPAVPPAPPAPAARPPGTSAPIPPAAAGAGAPPARAIPKSEAAPSASPAHVQRVTPPAAAKPAGPGPAGVAAAGVESRPAAVTSPPPTAAPVAAPKPPSSKGPAQTPVAPPPAASPAIQATAQPADDLTRIQGIDPGLRARLHELGVRRFVDIAGWRAADVTRISAALAFKGRIERENWIEQAQILANGGETFFSSRKRRSEPALATREQAPDRRASPEPRTASPPIATKLAPAAAAAPPPRPPTPVAGLEFDRRGAEVAESPPRPTRLADAIRSVAGQSASDGALVTRTAQGSVQSETAPGSPAADAAATAPAPSPQGTPAAGAGRTPRRDDLKRIRGVGVFLETKLNAMGITSYEQIANWSQPQIDRVSQLLELKGRIEREKWVEQARTLSAGDQTEFSQRIDRGEIEASRSKS